VALSGDPEDMYKTNEVILKEVSYNTHLCNWIRMAREKISFQGLPARICWLGYGERARFGKIINELVASGELKAPIVIGRDHLDSDRKSTRLNSSHVSISYAVFCLN